MPNTVHNKVTINGTTYIDLSTDTAVASDVAQGKYFHLATGERVAGTASGGGDNALIIQFSQNATTGYWEPDKTFAEIQTAYNNGLDIVLTSPNDSYQVSGGYDNGELSYQIWWYDYNIYKLINNFYIFDSNGVTDDGSQEFISSPTGTKQISITENGTTIEDVTNYANASIAVNVSGGQPNLQAKTNISPTTSSQTIQPDSGYDGLSSVQINAMPSGTAGTPTATKGSVSNHSVSVTPSVTNTTGYITGSTKTGTAVTVSASELVSGSETKTTNGTYDVTNLAQLVVNVSSSGSGKNVQVEHGTKRIAATAYTDVGYEITVAKTGTYNVYWAGWRSSTSGTNGAQLYVNGSASGNAITTFDGTWTNVQNGSRTSVSLTQNDKVTLRARSRGTSYYMYIFFLAIEET